MTAVKLGVAGTGRMLLSIRVQRVRVPSSAASDKCSADGPETPRPGDAGRGRFSPFILQPPLTAGVLNTVRWTYGSKQADL